MAISPEQFKRLLNQKRARIVYSKADILEKEIDHSLSLGLLKHYFKENIPRDVKEEIIKRYKDKKWKKIEIKSNHSGDYIEFEL